MISQAAFDGSVSSTSFSSTSPEFSTDGQYAKCWVREKDTIQLYKTGSVFGMEPVSEYLASQLAVLLCPEAAVYDLGFHHGELISKCALFTSERYGLAKAAVLTKDRTIAGFLRLAGDIPSLYGEPLTEYGKCYEALEFLIEGVLARLKEEEEQ